MKLPIGRQTDIYINAIKTEGEAADYIRGVTEAIHAAHEAAQASRAKPARKRREAIDIAAVAEEKPALKPKRAVKTKGTKG